MAAVTATGTPLGAIHATGGPGGVEVVEFGTESPAGEVVSTLSVVVVVATGLGRTATPAQALVSMSAAKSLVSRCMEISTLPRPSH
jgi:hypothetical protein